MADWKDFYEDNRESLGQFLDTLAARKASGKAEKPLRLRRCSFVLCATRLSFRTPTSHDTCSKSTAPSIFIYV